MRGLLIGLALVLALSGTALAEADRNVIYKGSRPADYFDLLALKEASERMMLIVGLVTLLGAALIGAFVLTSVNKKVEDEFNEIKQRYDIDLDPKTQMLVDAQRLQNLKDVFQTISQGSAALWTPHER